MWLPGETYDKLEIYAEGRSFARGGSPQLAACVREAIDHYLICPQKRQTQRQAEPVPEPPAPPQQPRQRKRQAAAD